jgi:hypothetical protein
MNFNAECRQIWEEDYNFDCIKVFENMARKKRRKINEIRFSKTVSKRLELNSQKYHKNMIKVIKMFPNVKKLIITNYFGLRDEHIAELGVVILENLEFLHLINNINLSGKTFERIANNCSNLTNFYFTCEIFGDKGYFYDIRTDDFLRLLNRNHELNFFGLNASTLPNAAYEELFNHGSLAVLELYLSRFDNVVVFMSSVFKLLVKLRTYLSVNIGNRNVITFDSNCLEILNIENSFGVFTNFNEECANFFKSSRNGFKSICLTGFTNLSNNTLDVIGECLHISHTLKLIDCGKNYDIEGVKRLLDNTECLRLMLVTGGDSSLGISNECYRFGKAILAVLKKGDCFKPSTIRWLKRKNKENEELFDEFVDYCIDFIDLDSYDFSSRSDDDNSSKETIDMDTGDAHFEKKRRDV